MNRRSVLVQAAGLITLAPFAPVLSAAEVRPAFRRGIGVSHAFGWAEVTLDGAYAELPFESSRFRFDAEQRRIIRQAGFDFVRLAVDVGPFLAVTGPRRDQLDALLFGTVRGLLDADLGVIVDLHPSTMHPAYSPAALTAGANTPPFRSLLDLLERLSAGLAVLAKERPIGAARLALELLNEPQVSPADWQPMLEAAYRAARAGSQQLPLVLGGGSMNAPDALVAINTRPFASDERLFYTFHDYEPWQFTHQGLRGNPAYGFEAVPYPAPADANAMIQATKRRIAGLALTGTELEYAQAAPRALTSYARSGFDRTALSKAFTRVAAWQMTHGLPAHTILLGEFGARLTPYARTEAGAAARLHWLRDMRELAEQHGFAWACWTYLGLGGFALAKNETGPEFDVTTRAALGLM